MNTQAIEKLKQYSDKKQKLTIIAKREAIEEIYQGLLKAQPEEIKKSQEGLSAVLISPQVLGSGGKRMLKAIEACLLHIFQTGDYNKVGSQLIQPLSSSIQSMNSADKSASEERLARIFLFSRFFLRVRHSCFLGSPPTKELVDLFTKVASSKNVDGVLRTHCFKAITRVLKASAQNVSAIVPDLIKSHTKLFEKLLTSTGGLSQHDLDVLDEILKGLTALVKESFGVQTLAQYHDTLMSLCNKGFCVESPSTQKAASNLLASMYTLRLEEAARQGDIKTSYVDHLEAQNQANDAKSKKKSTQGVLEIPRTLAEVFSYFSALMYKNRAETLFVEGLAGAICKILKDNRLHLLAVDIHHCLNSQLLFLQIHKLKGDADGLKTLPVALIQASFSIFETASSLMTFEQNQQLIESVGQTLEKRQLVMSRETVEQFSPTFNSQKDQLKVSSMLGSHGQQELCLKIYANLIRGFQEGQISAIFQSEASLIAPVIKFLRDDVLAPSTQTEAKLVVEAIALKTQNIQWMQALLYQFLQLTTIENADLQTFSQGGGAHLEQLEQKQRNLNTLAECMSFLMREIRQKSKDRAVPLALAESSMKVVKGLVLGDLIKSVQEEKDQGVLCYSVTLSEILESEELQNSRREAGWIILQGLLHQGEQWLSQNLETIFMLFNSIFNRDICGITGFTKVAQILKEFDLKLRALEALALLIKTCKTSLSKQYIKLASFFTCNCFAFLFNNSKDKEAKELLSIFQKASPKQYKEAKLQLLETISTLDHPNYFQPKMILILHVLCDQIVTAKRISDIPSVTRGIVENYISEDSGPTEQGQIVNDKLSRISIDILTNLFLHKSALTPKNKLQLVRHFESYSNVNEAKEKPHPGRLFKIGLVCLSLAKQNALIDPNDFEKSKLEADLIDRIVNIKNYLLKYQTLVPGLDQILAEISVYARMSDIQKQPNHIKLLLKTNEPLPALSIRTKALTISAVARLFDYDQFFELVQTESLNWLKQTITEESLTSQDLVCVLRALNSIIQACPPDKKQLCSNILSLAFHCLHASSFREAQSDMELREVQKIVSYLFEVESQLVTGSKVKILLERDLEPGHLARKVGSHQGLIKSIIEVQMQLVQRNEEMIGVDVLLSVFVDEGADGDLRKAIVSYIGHCLVYGGAELEGCAQTLFRMLNHLYRTTPVARSAHSLTFSVSNREVVDLLRSNPESNLEECLLNCLSLALKQQIRRLHGHKEVYSHVLSQFKKCLDFKHVTEFDRFEENPQQFIMQKSMNQQYDQFLTEAMDEGVLMQVSSYFCAYLRTIGGLETEFSFLKSQLFNLVTLSCKMVQRDQLEFKKIGVCMLSQVVTLFRHCVEKVGDEDSEDDAGGSEAAKGPLLLEIYVAHIHSVVRTCLQDQLQSFLYSQELHFLVEQFLTWGICTDSIVRQKTIEQLQAIFVIKPNRKSNELDYFELSQMYPEMICANAFAQRLALVNKVCLFYDPAMESTYLKLVKDFLIVVCAQALDEKNPNCIRDIKSLKILYPAGMGCAIDMQHLIECLVSILKLQIKPETNVDPEFRELRVNVVDLLLTSKPENLLISGEDKTLFALKVRSDVLNWLGGCPEFYSGSKSSLTSIYASLKANFELGILQVSHSVIRAYTPFLQTTEKGQLIDIQVIDIFAQTQNLKTSLSQLDTQISARIESDILKCQQALTMHLDEKDETHCKIKAHLMSLVVKAPLRQMVGLVTDDSPSSLKQINEVFQQHLSSLQTSDSSILAQTLCEITDLLPQLCQTPERTQPQISQKLSFVLKAFAMMVFQSIKGDESEVLVEMEQKLVEPGDKLVFVSTIIKLSIKEMATEAQVASRMVFSFCMQTLQNTEHTQILLPILVEFFLKFYQVFTSTNKSEVCGLLLSAFFTVLQSTSVGMEQKNMCAQAIVKVVNLDLVTFKLVAQSAGGKDSVAYLSNQEKVVIQNLMMKLGAAQK